ncbi:MAG: ATPase, T2SS/T4P/T4SS family [Castellaniella sp.]
MIHLHLRFEDGQEDRFQASSPLTVGRASEAQLRLRSWRVARLHARFERRPAGVFLDDLGALGGTFVNGQRITRYGPLTAEDDIVIGPCLMRLCDAEDGSAPPLVLPLVPGADAPVPTPGAGIRAAPGPVAEMQTAADMADSLPAGLLSERRRLHKALLEALDLRRRDLAAMSDDALKAEAADILSRILTEEAGPSQAPDRAGLIRDVVDEAVGLGLLEPLLLDGEVTEIMVNRHDEIYVERLGRLHRHAGGFSSEQAVMGVIERIVSPLGRRVDESSPMVDARLPDGSRVNVVLPPVALRGVSLTIRKFPLRRPGMDDLLSVGSLDRHMSLFLAACVTQRKNIVVSGGTGSGKTTLLNILSNCIPSGERIVTIEDAAELQLNHEHRVTLEARPPNLEGRGAISIRDLVRNALRMRPDRIVVGECRGAEAFDMLAAMNTGHEGSLTTLHANSPRDALNRLETMVLMAGMDLPLAAVREHVASSLDIIVQQARLSSGHRLITSVVQVTGQESGRIQLQELFCHVLRPVAGFRGCGIIPEGFELDAAAGLGVESFNQTSPLAGCVAGAAAWAT